MHASDSSKYEQISTALLTFMFFIRMLQLVVLSLCLSMTLVRAVPDWSTNPYTVKGQIVLPYGNIIEPFEAWIDPATKRSRIDYYNGMNTILYLNGPGFKIAPVSYNGVSVF